jgi:predicted O-methyltransferase YrrM
MSPAGPQGREAAPRRVRRVRERLLHDGTGVSHADGATRRLEPLAISPAEGEALRGWVVGEGAARTIEIGLGYGISALFVCEGLLESGGPDARHVVVDPYQARLGDCGLQVLEEAGLMPLVEHHAEESQLALPRMLGEGWRFDLAFVDGNHRFDGVFLDLVYLGRLLRRGAVVFLDDYQLPAVARAASFFLRNRAWTLEEVSPADALHQWAVLRTSRTADERPFDFYVEF